MAVPDALISGGTQLGDFPRGYSERSRDWGPSEKDRHPRRDTWRRGHVDPVPIGALT